MGAPPIEQYGAILRDRIWDMMIAQFIGMFARDATKLIYYWYQFDSFCGALRRSMMDDLMGSLVVVLMGYLMGV